jgi:hypothetical protein
MFDLLESIFVHKKGSEWIYGAWELAACGTKRQQ